MAAAPARRAATTATTATARTTTATSTRATRTRTQLVPGQDRRDDRPQHPDDEATGRCPVCKPKRQRQHPSGATAAAASRPRGGRPPVRSVLEAAGGTRARSPGPAEAAEVRPPSRPDPDPSAGSSGTTSRAPPRRRAGFASSVCWDFRAPPPCPLLRGGAGGPLFGGGAADALRRRQVAGYGRTRGPRLLARFGGGSAAFDGEQHGDGGELGGEPSPFHPLVAAHRNEDGAPYCSAAFLDPRDDVVAAIDERGRVDVVRLGGPGAPSASSVLVQRVSLHSGGAHAAAFHYKIRSFQGGRALAVGMPSGEFRILATEAAAASPALSLAASRRSAAGEAPWPRQPARSPRRRHLHPLSFNSTGADPCSPLLFASCWRAHRPMRKYRACPEWTLADQMLRTFGGSPRGVADGVAFDGDDRVEIAGWNDPDADADWLAPSRPPGGGRGDLLAPRWDFCEAPGSFLLGAHVGHDYVGVKLVEDRADRTHVLVLGRPSAGSGSAASPGHARSVAFCAGGRLLATGHRRMLSSAPSSSPAEKDGAGTVLLWDLRMTRRPSAAVLPSFPREAAHLLSSEDAVAALAGSNGPQGRGGVGGPPTIELPEIPRPGADCDQPEDSHLFRASLVCLSPLERAVLVRKLLPRAFSGRRAGAEGAAAEKRWILASSVRDDGHCVEADRDFLYWTDLERQVLERGGQKALGARTGGGSNKRPRERTLMRLFDGTLTPPPDPEAQREPHHPGCHGAARLRLEDRYGCSTSLCCLAASRHADRVAGGTCDGDLFVLGARAL